MGVRAEGVSYAERMALGGRRREWMVRERTVGREGAEPDGTAPQVSKDAEAPGDVSAEMSEWDTAAAEGALRRRSEPVEPTGDVSAEMSEWDTRDDPAASDAGPVGDPAASGRTPVDHEPDYEAVDHEPVDQGALDQEAIENDEMEELGNEIATIAAHIHAAEYQLLVKLAEFDRRQGWEVCGFRNCAAWLAFRTGMSTGACRERVRVARALEKLPKISAAMAGGELSFSQVRALTRVATPENEAELLEYAESCS
ncbi:MAG: DUF222 domain-containing protein, partial [Gemmatimonadota bacterium]